MKTKAKSNKKTPLEHAMNSLISSLESTEKFILDQAPEVCRQLIAAQKVEYLMDSVASGIVTIGLAVACFLLKKAGSETSTGGPDFKCFMAAVCGEGSLGFLIGFYKSVQTLLILKVSPKAFLLRKLRNLI